RLVITTVRERAAVVAEYVVGRKLASLDNERCWGFRYSRRCGPFVVAAGKLANGLIHQSLDVRAIDVPDHDEQHSRRDELRPVVGAKCRRIRNLKRLLVSAH